MVTEIKESITTKHCSSPCQHLWKCLVNGMENMHTDVKGKELKPFNSQDLIHNSPYCQPYSFSDVSLENLVLDQLIIP